MGLLFTPEGVMDDHECLHLPSTVHTAITIATINLIGNCSETSSNDKVSVSYVNIK